MIVGMLIVLVFLLLLILINKSLKHNSKNCDIKVRFSIKSFEFNFKTTEKNAPSNHD
jgi:hypothetical protein